MSKSSLYSAPVTHDKYFTKNSVTRARGERLLSLYGARGKEKGLLLLSEPGKVRLLLVQLLLVRLLLVRLPAKKVFRD